MKLLDDYGLKPRIDRKLCECGCGNEVRNRFIRGHHIRVLVRSLEYREEMSKAGIRNWKKSEFREKMSRAINKPEYKEKMSKVQSEAHNRPEVKEKHSKAMSRNWEIPEYREKQSEVQKIVHNRSGVKLKQRIAGIKRWNNPEYREKTSRAMSQANNRPEVKEKHSRASIRNWKNSEYSEKQRIAMNIKPNKPEKYLIELFDKLSLPIRYVGDFNFWVKFENGKNRNPDFKVDGKKKVIEFHGDYWHKGEDENILIKQFKEIGYDCLVIWEHDLKDISKTITRVRYFLYNI